MYVHVRVHVRLLLVVVDARFSEDGKLELIFATSSSQGICDSYAWPSL